jgi:hypothetical protein
MKTIDNVKRINLMHAGIVTGVLGGTFILLSVRAYLLFQYAATEVALFDFSRGF